MCFIVSSSVLIDRFLSAAIDGWNDTGQAVRVCLREIKRG